MAAGDDIVSVKTAMRRLAFVLALPIAFGCTRVPALPERPSGVPAEAVLVPGEGMLANSSVWVYCSPPTSPLQYVCSVFPLKFGATRRTGQFTLMLAHRPAPSDPPAELPTSLNLRSYDGFMLRVQEPWVLVSIHPQADPPLPAVGSPATGSVADAS
jgi:hypothetical protein